MIRLKILWGPNKLARQKMAGNSADFASVATQIRVAHHAYLTGPRAPTTLTPLKLADPLADWIREKYKTAPKYLALDWIKKVRDEHDLVICPMCGGTSVATLEHVLPKADYPEFAVLSFNLVPCCDGCQRRRSNKGNKYDFIHPYFDHALLDSLRLIVRFTPPYYGVLFLIFPLGVTGVDLLRAQRHLKESIPGRLFQRHMKSLWLKWHKRGYRDKEVETRRRLFEDLGEAEQLALNSWEAAFLRGLSQDSVVLSWMANNPP